MEEAPQQPTQLSPSEIEALVAELPESVTYLSKETPTGRCDFFIIGTAHISKTSAEEVIAVVDKIRPNVVFMELCHSRTALLLNTEESLLADYEKKTTMQDIRNAIGGKSGSSGLLQLLLGTIFKKAVEQIKVAPGAEFRAGLHAAVRNKAQIILGDRPVMVTLKRTWAFLSTWEKLKLGWSILTEDMTIKEEDIERFKNADFLTELMEDFVKEFPTLSTPLITERDKFLAFTLRACARMPNCTQVVAIVGMGHVKGIKKYWDDETIDPQALMHIPPTHFKRNLFIFVGSLIVAVVAWRARLWW